MTAPPDPLQQQAAAMRQSITINMISLLRQAWLGLGSYRTAADIAKFQIQALAIVRAAQNSVIALVGAYLQRNAEIAGQTWTARSVNAAFLDTLRQGIDFTQEYERPFQQLWTALGSGANFDQAMNTGLTRLTQLASTDLQLASTRSAQQMIAAQPAVDGKLRIVGYERVTTSGHPCALCLIASTQRYHVADLMPIHPGCQCMVDPIWGTAPTDRVIHPELLGQIHQAIVDQFGAKNASATFVPGQSFDYKDVLIVHQHGEIGPVLAVRGQHFTGPAQAKELAAA